MPLPGDASSAAPSAAVHWDEVYAVRDPSSVSWYQRDPSVSLRLIQSLTTSSSAIVDVGAGASTLADHLSALGYRDLTLVDVSRVALDAAAARLASCSGISLVEGDVLAWRAPRPYDLWHDRALFHFLVSPLDQGRYVDVAAAALRPGGFAVLGCFADDGPTNCSGLAVARHSATDLATLFAPAFELESSEREVHRTPTGADQAFTWVVLRRARS